MRDIDKRAKKRISVDRRDLWDSKPYWHFYYREIRKTKLKQDTGGIRKARMPDWERE